MRYHLPLRTIAILTLSLVGSMASGCGLLDAIFGGYLNANGARGTISQERAPEKTYGSFWGGTENDFKEVDIVPLLTGGQFCQGNPDNDIKDPTCVEWAFNCFHYYSPGQCPQPGAAPAAMPTPTLLDLANATTVETQQARRNDVQERLIAASNSSCREFEQHLNSVQSYTNLALGIAALGTGAAGAVVSSAVAASALAGTTGALAGTRAEFNNDIFVKQLFSTISQAIDTSRQQYLEKLRGSKVEQVAGLTQAETPTPTASPSTSASPTPTPTPNASATVSAANSTPANKGTSVTSQIVGKQSLTPSVYPVEAAVADAIFYNDLCSLNKGLQSVSKSVQASDDIGLSQFLTDVQKYKQIELLMQTSNAAASPASTSSPAAQPTAEAAKPARKPKAKGGT
ncbi:MAG: hypothetical protein ACLQDV_19740 [Candidatus Binataceae bacterium]